jgi:hypothetical protein
VPISRNPSKTSRRGLIGLISLIFVGSKSADHERRLRVIGRTGRNLWIQWILSVPEMAPKQNCSLLDPDSPLFVKRR